MDRPTAESWYGRAIPTALAANKPTLPVIDIAPLIDGDLAARRAVAAEIREACFGTGFFYITGHGVPQAVIDDTFAMARAFFALPEAEKSRILMTDTPGYAGYSPMLDLNYGDPARASLVESFNMNLDLPLDHPRVLARQALYLPNSWPTAPAGFKAVVGGWHDRMRGLGDRLFEAFALALDVEPDFFIRRTRTPIALMRINHYPPQLPDVDHGGRIGAAPHTDYECFTILAQEGALQALEVVGPDDQWLPVPPIAGAFVVNVGDQMERWTNGRFRSTMHRVINANVEDRCSIAFFHGADADALIEVLPTCLEPGESPRHPPITAGDYVAGRVADVYGHGIDGNKDQ